MSIEQFILGSSMAGMFLGLIFYVVFGQVTVKKLRKNPKTRETLGVELVSGWDIYNVAQALSLPRFITQRLENSSISFLYANTTLLRENTSSSDRILGFIFYWSFTISALALIVLATLNGIGVL